MQRSSALFLLKLKEQQRITQVALDDVVNGSRALFSETINRVQASVEANLAETGFDPDSIPGLRDAFRNVADPFKDLETQFLQQKYFRDKFNLIVSKLRYFSPYMSLLPWSRAHNLHLHVPAHTYSFNSLPVALILYIRIEFSRSGNHAFFLDFLVARGNMLKSLTLISMYHC